MNDFLKDLRFSLRMLRRSPVVTAAAVLSLALGIGANTAIFSLVRSVLLEPVRVPEVERVVGVFTVDEKLAQRTGSAELPMSYPNFLDYRERSDAFEDFVAVLSNPLALVGEGPPERLSGHLVSSGYFDMMRLEPALGRFFSEQENAAESGVPVAVLSYDLWQRRFGGDPEILGRTLRLNDTPFEVIGVAPRGFTGTGLFTPEIWIPMGVRDQVLTGQFRAFFDVRRALMLNVYGRLAPGWEREQAEDRMESIAARLAADHPEANEGRGVALLPVAQANLPPGMRGTFVRAGGVLMLVVGLVLLIACANVANLLLVRARARRTEIGIRISLGVPRGRLVRQLLLDGLLLALAGGALGLLVARVTRDLLWGLRPPLLAATEPDLSLDPTVLSVTLGLSLLTGVLFALAPISQLFRVDLVSSLKGQRNVPAVGGRLATGRNLLVVGQVALSLVALVGSGLFLSSLQNLRSVDLGFDADRLAVLSFNLGAAGYEPGRMEEFQRRARQTAEALPGVEEAALGRNRPMSPFRGTQRTVIPEGEGGEEREGQLASVDVVSRGYFETLGVPLIAGRPFEAFDQADSRPVAAVSETLADLLWPDGDAVGRRFQFSGQDGLFEVVGVAADRKYSTPGESPQPYLHLLLDQNPQPFMNLFVRTSRRPEVVLEELRRAVQELDPNLPLTDPATMEGVIEDSLWASRLGTVLLAVFGFLALALTAIGIYGVLSYSAEQRQREIGIRMAVGANRGRVLRLVLAEGLAVVAVGLVAGALISVGLSRTGWISDLLFAVDAADPTVYAGAAAVLAAIALVATLLPARQATRVDPTRVLRGE